MKRHELVRHLHLNGCALVREGTRHSIYRNSASDRLTALPRHIEIANDLARKICRDSGIPPP